jgi:hypothetical protein
MAEQYAYENPKVVLRERADAGLIEFGFDIDGAFIPFGAAKLGGFQEDLQEAREQAQDQQAQEAREQAQQAQPQTGAGDTTQTAPTQSQ